MKKIDRTEMFKMLDDGVSTVEIAKVLGIGRATVARAKQEWKKLNRTTTSEHLHKRSYSQIDFVKRLGMSLTLVGYTRWDGYPVYTFCDRYTHGFENTFIVFCPGTTELYDERIFGKIECTYDQLTEFIKKIRSNNIW